MKMMIMSEKEDDDSDESEAYEKAPVTIFIEDIPDKTTQK